MWNFLPKKPKCPCQWTHFSNISKFSMKNTWNIRFQIFFYNNWMFAEWTHPFAITHSTDYRIIRQSVLILHTYTQHEKRERKMERACVWRACVFTCFQSMQPSSPPSHPTELHKQAMPCWTHTLTRPFAYTHTDTDAYTRSKEIRYAAIILNVRAKKKTKRRLKQTSTEHF